MDSITHIALGACMGEAFAGEKLGKKAMLWGALAQSIPDIDFVASFWMDLPSELLAHRGFTHSFLFTGIIALLFALIAERFHRPHNLSFKQWYLFFLLVIFGHLFFDAFNNYGTGWFEPFSSYRVSFHTLYVADPFFSIWTAIAFVMLLFKRQTDAKRSFWWKFGFIMTGLYMGYCILHKYTIDREVRAQLARQNISYTRYFTTPAPLQNWLWYVVAGNDSGYYTGFRSVYEPSEKPMQLTYFPRRDDLLKPVNDHESLQKLIRFSQQYFTVAQWSDTLVFNDLRFGQIIGWKDARRGFVFHYFLNHPENNELVVQRGRFAGWDVDVFISLVRRIIALP
ncbi:MAG: metal-dependent hydrolase [Chitinophagaceae bacterium]